MKTYSNYLEVLKKMEQIQKLLLEMKGKKISEISEDREQQIRDICYTGEYDKDADIGDLYFIKPDDVFDLFRDLNELEITQEDFFNYLSGKYNANITLYDQTLTTAKEKIKKIVKEKEVK